MLSKSCENSIVCWKSGSLDQSEKEKEQRTTIIHKLDVSISDGDYVWKLVGIHLMKGWTISDKFTYVNQILFQIRDCEIWFVRFSTDLEEKTLALGNTKGKIYTWDLTVLLHDLIIMDFKLIFMLHQVSDPTSLRPAILSHPKCNTAVRQTSLSRSISKLLIVI